MSTDKNSSEESNVSAVDLVAANKANTQQQFGRGTTVGTATASQAIKALWHENGKKLSLKRYARKLLADGNAVAQEWFSNKAGGTNAARSDQNKAKAQLASQASKGKKKA